MLNPSRHAEVVPTHLLQDYPISLIGAGAVGSRIFAHLVELGCMNLRVYDPDVVEPHNLANQLFSTNDVGRSKTEALRAWYEWKTGEPCPDSTHLHPVRAENGPPPRGLVFMCVDSFAKRANVFDAVIKDNAGVTQIIDTRMAARHGNILYFGPTAVDRFPNSLGDDETAETSACGTSLTVGATAAVIAAQAVWTMINALSVNTPLVTSRTNIYCAPEALTATES